MSGYDQKTGIFELTATKARYWFRRKELPEQCRGVQVDSFMGLVAAILRAYGREVLLVKDSYLQVRATPGQVWEALSGTPSDPKREAYYLRK